MRKKIVLTGGSGFLGKRVVSLLEKEYDLILLGRSQIPPFQADITKWNCGLDLHSIKKVLGEGEVFAFLHMAALYDLTASEVDCFKSNISGTHNALVLAEKLGARHFVNISTIASVINSEADVVDSVTINLNRKFPDAYSESKAHAETIVKQYASRFKNTVNLRLGILVGDSIDGRIERLDGPYMIPEFFKSRRNLVNALPGPLILPGSGELTLPIVPIDKAASGVGTMIKLLDSTKLSEGFGSFYLTPKFGVSIYELFRDSLNECGLNDKKLIFLKGIPKKISKSIGHRLLGMPEETLHYMLNLKKYESDSTRMLLGADWCPEYSSYKVSFWRGYEAYISNR